jgi:hypothetical protein
MVHWGLIADAAEGFCPLCHVALISQGSPSRRGMQPEAWRPQRERDQQKRERVQQGIKNASAQPSGLPAKDITIHDHDLCGRQRRRHLVQTRQRSHLNSLP